MSHPKTAYHRARRERMRSQRVAVQAFGTILMVHPHAPHGTMDGAKNYLCECPDCRAAAVAAERDRKARRATS